MSILPPEHWDDFSEYGIFDEDGTQIGIRDDAPDDVKQAYADMTKAYADAEKQNIQL